MKTTQELYEQMLADYEAATGFAMQDSCDLAVRLYAAAAQLQALRIMHGGQKFPIRQTNRNENCHTRRNNPVINYAKMGGAS